MTMQDLNQVTISGHILSEPQLHRFDDEDAYTLTHTTEHHQHWR